MATSTINDKAVFFDEKKKVWRYKNTKIQLATEILAELNKKIKRMEAEKEAKFVLAECLGNFGVPAKKRFFKPVAGMDNKKVWPPHEKENRSPLFVLAKGEQYEVHPRIMDNPGAKTMFKAVK